MRRLALVLGIAAYDRDPLPNTISDVQRVSSVLSRLGFECRMLFDSGARDIEDALSDFERSTGGDELSLIYFAGHGVEQYGSGYVLPRDFPFPISSSKLRHYAISIKASRGAI
jgi:uncharacterized caspase-like protein